MSEKGGRSIDERIARLEALVKEFQRQIGQINDRLFSSSVKETTGTVPPGSDSSADIAPGQSDKVTFRPAAAQSGFEHTPPKRRDYPWSHWKSEDWLSKIGIALLLFGVVFLFKYSIDQGWLTPAIRVWTGVALGIFLIAIGLYIYTKRNTLALVLMGGGIAVFYITDFAAFQFYDLIPHAVAFSCMVSISLLSLYLSIHKNRAILSIVGTIGGLGTPFLLYTEEGSIFGLITYTCFVIAGTSAIYVHRGWRSILLVSAIGGWLIFLISGVEVLRAADPSLSDKSIVQAGIFFGMFAFWAVPVMRDVFRTKNPDRWHAPSLDFLEKYGFLHLAPFINRFNHILVVAVPLFVLGISRIVWDISDLAFGLYTLAGSSFFAAGYVILNKRNLPKLAYTHGLSTILLLTLSIVQIFDGTLLFIALAAEAAILHRTAHKLSDSIIRGGAHFLFIITAFILLTRLSTIEPTDIVIFNKDALSDLAVIMIALSITSLFKSEITVRSYRMIAHLEFIGLLAREFSALDNGQAYVTISWGVYAIILLFAAYSRKNDKFRIAGLATLLLVVGKLFLVDLTQLEAIWRILLFFGFGGLFLILSYYMPSLWKSSSVKENRNETE